MNEMIGLKNNQLKYKISLRLKRKKWSKNTVKPYKLYNIYLKAEDEF